MTFAEGEDVQRGLPNSLPTPLPIIWRTRRPRYGYSKSFARSVSRSRRNTDGEQRALIRRSPLPPAAVAQLQAWLAANLAPLAQAAAGGRLLDAIRPTILEFTTAWSIRALSNPAIVPRALSEWVDGRSFAVILTTIVDAGIRVGR